MWSKKEMMIHKYLAGNCFYKKMLFL